MPLRSPRSAGPSVARRARLARRFPLLGVGTGLACFGAFWGSWAVSAFDVQHYLRFSPAGLGLLLSAGILFAAAANALGGSLVERHGADVVRVWFGRAWATMVIVLGTVPGRDAFVVLFVVSVAAAGAFDLSLNVVSASALAPRPGSLMRLHGMFNLGCVLGAGLTAALAAGGVSWRWAWVAVGGAAWAVSALEVRRDARTSSELGTRGGESPAGFRSLVGLWRAGLATLAVVFALAAITEGGVETWGVLFLRSRLGIGLVAGAAAYMVGQGLATGARVGLGPSLGLLGGTRGASVGATFATCGLVLEIASPAAGLAAVGLGLAVMGVSACWPLLLSSVGGAERPGLAVGAVTTAGYLGMLAGPVVVGALASAAGLVAGLSLIAACALGVAVSAMRLRPEVIRAAASPPDPAGTCPGGTAARSSSR